MKYSDRYFTFDIALIADRIEDNEILTNLQPQQLLDAHLPLQNLQDGYDLYAEISQIDSPTFVEELSQSLWKRYVKDVQPVFFFPGLSLTSMKSFIKKCMYPSYLAHIPAGWSMDDIVAHLCKVGKSKSWFIDQVST